MTRNSTLFSMDDCRDLLDGWGNEIGPSTNTLRDLIDPDMERLRAKLAFAERSPVLKKFSMDELIEELESE